MFISPFKLMINHLFLLPHLLMYHKGGCALFLETILHIHGTPRITKMIRKSRGLSQSDKVPPLAACICEQRQHRKWMERLQQQHPTEELSTEEQMPQGHECMSTELMSLLLTGKVHADMVSWSADNLGIGLLSVNNNDDASDRGDMISRLKLPPKPIWLVRGDVCYSTLWNNNMKASESRSNSFADEESDSIMLTHWNCWYGVPNKTEMRVVPSTRGKVEIPRIMSERDPKFQKGVISTPVLGPNSLRRKENGNTNPILMKEIRNTEIHPEDKQYYPNNFRRWRFRFNYYAHTTKGSNIGEDEGDDEDVQSQKLPAWIAFFRLSRRQKEIVERKLSPRINLAIWSKWPEATVDKIETPIIT